MFCVLWICLFWIFYVNGIICGFCVWILSHSLMFSWFIHNIIQACCCCNFITVYSWIIFIVWIFYILLIHSSVDRQSCCFHCLAIMNNVAMNTNVRIFVWTYFFNSPEHIPKRGIAGYSVFNILRNWQTFPKSTTFYILTSNVWRFPFFHILTNTCYCLSFWL